jgi:hypothetical protein
MVRKEISDEKSALQTVGTDTQKEHETEVISYQKKIGDFTVLLKNHEFASNVFAFMQAQTMPNIWFSQFNLDEKNKGVQLSGESDDVDAFSRQVAVLEKNPYVKNIGTLNSSLGQAARTEFNIGLVLDQSIFNYLPSMSLIPAATASGQPTGTPASQTTPASSQGPAGSPPATVSSEKLMTSFHLLLNPEVVGIPDETNYIFTLNVPYGTSVTSLTPAIVISPTATISPASLVPQDFTNPVTYVVTAQDGSTQSYQVKVVVAPPPEVKKSNQSGSTLLIFIILVIIIVAVIAGVFLLIWRKNKQKR